MRVALHFVLVSLAASPISGCWGIGGEDAGQADHCGTAQKVARYSEANPFANATQAQRKTTHTESEVVFAFSMGTEGDACKDQEIPYTVDAHVAPAGALDTCDPSAPRVWVTETAVAGSTPANLTPRDISGGLGYHRAADLGLAQAKTEPVKWDVTLNIAFPKVISKEDDEACGKQRITFVDMSADYYTTDSSETTTPSGSGAATCDHDSMVQAHANIPPASHTTAANASDSADPRIYTWTIGVKDAACRDQPVNYAMSLALHAPASNSACTDAPPIVTLQARTPSGPIDLPPNKSAGREDYTNYQKDGLLELKAAADQLASWSLTMNLSLAATDHGALDDACAKDLVAGISLEGVYWKPAS